MFCFIIPIPVQLHRDGPLSVPSCWSLLCFIKFYFIMVFLVLFHLVAPCSFLSYCFLFCLIMFVIVLLYLIGSCSVPTCAPPLPCSHVGYYYLLLCWSFSYFIRLLINPVLFYHVVPCYVISCVMLLIYLFIQYI